MNMVIVALGFIQFQVWIVLTNAVQDSHAKCTHSFAECFSSVLSNEDDMITGVVGALCLLSKFHATILVPAGAIVQRTGSPPRPDGLGFPGRVQKIG